MAFPYGLLYLDKRVFCLGFKVVDLKSLGSKTCLPAFWFQDGHKKHLLCWWNPTGQSDAWYACAVQYAIEEVSIANNLSREAAQNIGLALCASIVVQVKVPEPSVLLALKSPLNQSTRKLFWILGEEPRRKKGTERHQGQTFSLTRHQRLVRGRLQWYWASPEGVSHLLALRSSHLLCWSLPSCLMFQHRPWHQQHTTNECCLLGQEGITYQYCCNA